MTLAITSFAGTQEVVLHRALASFPMRPNTRCAVCIRPVTLRQVYIPCLCRWTNWSAVLGRAAALDSTPVLAISHIRSDLRGVFTDQAALRE